MYHFNLGLKFENIAQQHASQTAIKLPSSQIATYQQLNQQANQIARLFLEKNIQPHNVVTISSVKTIHTFASILACLKIGAIYTIVDRHSPEERLNKILQNCQPKLICTDKTLQQKILNLISSYQTIDITSLEFKNTISSYSMENLAETKKVTSNQPAYIMYTSGSTGFPKGAIMTHANVLNLISWSQTEFSFTPEDILTNVNPLFFDNSVFDLYSSLFTGACLVPFDRQALQTPQKVIETIDQFQVTSWFSVPSLLIYFNSLKIFSPCNMKKIKRIIFGGEGYPLPKLKLLYGIYGNRCELINVYGPTECTCICSAYRIQPKDINGTTIGLPPLGKLIPNFHYLLLDENNQLVPNNKPGELCLLGPQVGKGYYRDLERTQQSFTPNPLQSQYYEIMYKTGDLIKCDNQNNLHFISRQDYQIKHMGYRIELGEIEHALNTLNYISEAAVIYGPLKSINQILAVITCKTDQPETTIKQDLQNIIPHYMVPRKIIKVPEIIKNPNGKIDRKTLTTTYFN